MDHENGGRPMGGAAPAASMLRGTPLEAPMRAALHSEVDAVGAQAVAKRLDVTHTTVVRAVAGLPLYKHTRRRITEALGSKP